MVILMHRFEEYCYLVRIGYLCADSHAFVCLYILEIIMCILYAQLYICFAGFGLTLFPHENNQFESRLPKGYDSVLIVRAPGTNAKVVQLLCNQPSRGLIFMVAERSLMVLHRNSQLVTNAIDLLGDRVSIGVS